MRWLTYLFPRQLERATSPYNADIRVVMDGGKNKLMVNGIHESSEYIAKFWSYAIEHLHVTPRLCVNNILILGVAGGTVIHMLHAIYPHARMLGVDIDEVMIDLGKEYFGLGDISTLSFVTKDARAYVQAHKKQKYDLIVVDIYIARDLPDFLRDERFLKDIRRLLSLQGHVLINYLRDGEYEVKAKDLERKLQKIYSVVHHTDYLNNRFFLAQK